jgi:hypothetical protein
VATSWHLIEGKEMKSIGYGVLQNGTPTGIWPRPWNSALSYIKKLKEKGARGTYEIVPIFIGATIEVLIPLEGEKVS